jgi:O-antigen/teichoic acid export membrane protein
MFFGMRDLFRPMILLISFYVLRPDTPDSAMLIICGVWGFILMLLMIYMLITSRLLLPRSRFTFRRWAKFLPHTTSLIFGNLTSRMAAYVDVLVLTYIVGLSLVGEYRTAAQFAIGFTVVQHFIFLGLPWQIHQRQDEAGLDRVRNRQRILLLLSLVALVVLSVMSEFILGLLGDRFIDMAPVFILFLSIRFAALLWGPQHEILISNGLALDEAYSYLTSFIVWIILFAGFYQLVSPLSASVAAGIGSAYAGQYHRWSIQKKHSLHAAFGHKFGPYAPAVVSGLLLVLSFYVLKV